MCWSCTQQLNHLQQQQCEPRSTTYHHLLYTYTQLSSTVGHHRMRRGVITLIALALACTSFAAPAHELTEPWRRLKPRGLELGWFKWKPGAPANMDLPPVPPKRYYVLCDRNVTFERSGNVNHLNDCRKMRDNYIADPEAPPYWLYDEDHQGQKLMVGAYGHCQLTIKYFRHQRFYFGNQDFLDIVGGAIARNANGGMIGSCANHHPHDELRRQHWAKPIYWRLDSLQEPVAHPLEKITPITIIHPNEFAAVPAWAAPPPPD
jgi:hypothetical protein